jgi:serine/threonine-protein kinase
VQERVDFYNTNPIKSENGDRIVCYLQDSQHLLDDRPQTYNHGDYGVSNLIVTPNGQIGVIDFSCFDSDHGDPWWEFDSIPWGTEPSAHFYTGLIKGYFEGEPPSEFFKVFSYYLAYDALVALCDTSKGEQGEQEDGRRHMENILHWFDNMNTSVPTWYLKDFYIQCTDDVPYKLKAPFDFSFLRKYGKVFKVFDDQDSGNICFGMTDGESRYFIKFAGAPTERACVRTEDAVANLKRTVPIYKDLAHPNLIKLVDAEEIGGGFAMVFEWADAECMHPMYPRSRKKFMQMTLETRFQVFEDILAYHAHVAKQGYVAIDFYDGSIMYDFGEGKTIICDIDFYAKAPYINSMGRLWGSSRFMSPEEFQFGAVIDEITNVYAMGATAFALFGDERDRCIEKWKLSKELFNVAKRAVSDQREKRQQSIKQLMEEWRAAKAWKTDGFAKMYSHIDT